MGVVYAESGGKKRREVGGVAGREKDVRKATRSRDSVEGGSLQDRGIFPWRRPKKRGIPHSADSVRNDGLVLFPQPVEPDTASPLPLIRHRLAAHDRMGLFHHDGHEHVGPVRGRATKRRPALDRKIPRATGSFQRGNTKIQSWNLLAIPGERS